MCVAVAVAVAFAAAAARRGGGDKSTENVRVGCRCVYTNGDRAAALPTILQARSFFRFYMLY